MTWEPDRRLLTVEEAARSIDRPESTIRRWLAEGRLKAAGKIGRKKLVLESHLLQVDADTARQSAGTVGAP